MIFTKKIFTNSRLNVSTLQIRLSTVKDNGGVTWMEKQNMNYNINDINAGTPS